MKADAIQEVINELAPLAGGRIQKIDRTGDREIVFSIRVPGRTLLLLISADAKRVHLIADKPPRTVPGGNIQRSLRERIEGRPLVSLSSEGGRFVRLDGGDGVLEIDLAAKQPFRFLPPSGAPLPDMIPVPENFPVSERLDQELVRVGPTEAENRLKISLLGGLAKRAKKLERLAANLEGDRLKLERMEGEARFGELLKSMLHQVPKGAPEIEAVDWTTGEPITVRLDPALSAKANMERYFVRAKKAGRGSPIVAKRIGDVTAKLDAIRRERARIEAAEGDSLQQIAARVEDGSPAVAESPNETKPEKRRPIDRWSRKFVAADGSEIRVGRGAAENDRLTLNGARGHDLWLHARGTAGAHVVLRVEKGHTADREAVLDAAHLAAFYSSAKNDSKVEIITTDAKHVKKSKGDPPGRVSVAKGKTVLIEMDGKRLDRLLGRER